MTVPVRGGPDLPGWTVRLAAAPTSEERERTEHQGREEDGGHHQRGEAPVAVPALRPHAAVLVLGAATARARLIASGIAGHGPSRWRT